MIFLLFFNVIYQLLVCYKNLYYFFVLETKAKYIKLFTKLKILGIMTQLLKVDIRVKKILRNMFKSIGLLHY